LYEGLKNESEGNDSMLEHLEASRAKLEKHYHTHYTNSTPPCLAPSPTMAISTPSSPQKVDFTLRYRKSASLNELEEYFKLPQEDFLTCDSVKWWAGHHYR
jgi:hypothetical protein